MRAPAGDPGTPSLVPPGDPAGLRRAALAARTAAERMGEAASTTRAAVMPAPEWSGPAAATAAARTEALSAAQQIGSDAFYSAAAALDTYADELEAAQATGRRAEAAAEDYRAYKARLDTLPPPATLTANSALVSPLFGQEQRAALTAETDSAAQQAATLGTQAATAAAEAAAKAAAAFTRIAALAGNPANHHSSDPFAADTATANATDAAETALSALSMAGAELLTSKTGGADTHILADVYQDPALAGDAKVMLSARLAADRSATELAAGYTKVLSERGIPLPRGLDDLDPVLQAGLLGWMVTHVEPSHQPWWEQAVSAGLRVGAAALGTAGVVTGAVSLLLPPGADVIGEGVGGAEDAAAAGAEAGSEAVSAAAKAAKLGRTLDIAGAGSATGAFSFDAANTARGATEFDPITFALDAASVLPAAGAVAADLRLANLGESLASARLAGDPATFAAVRAQITATGAARIVLGAKAFAIGAGATAYSAGTLAAPAGG